MQDKKLSRPYFGILLGLILLASAVYGALFQYQQTAAQTEAQSEVVAMAAKSTTASVAMATTPTKKATATKRATATATTTTVATTQPVAAAPPQASEAVVTIVSKAGCAGCHAIPGVPAAMGSIGPNLANIGVDGADRKPGYTVEAYILESIRTPNEFLAPLCPTGPCMANIMPQNLAQTLTAAEIDTLVAYLVTLQSEE